MTFHRLLSGNESFLVCNTYYNCGHYTELIKEYKKHRYRKGIILQIDSYQEIRNSTLGSK